MSYVIIISSIIFVILGGYIIFTDFRSSINMLIREEDMLMKYHKDIEKAKDWEEVERINSQFISDHPENLTPSELYISIRKRTRPI